jgi:two-component system, chemotaxis family, CheB/CheR fusion protein
MPDESVPEFEALLLHLKESRGFEFTAYKRATLERRVTKRMATVGIGSYAEYIDYLEVHPEEFAALFNTILINVTSFFRDAPAWEAIAVEVIPRILSGWEADRPIRIWSAGCASGEEAYTIAMLFCEAMGVQQFRDNVKIYATDIDEEDLTIARAAAYSAKQVQAVPSSFRENYFEPSNGRLAFRKDLRRAVIFGRHDLLQDAPISRLDLLVSRNTLMYFNSDAQNRILSRFYYALNQGAFLFLGKAETMLAHPQIFAPVNLKLRIFEKPDAHPAVRERLVITNGELSPDDFRVARETISELSFEADPVAQVLIDVKLNLVMANGRARSLFGLTDRDAGRPFHELSVSYHPAELRPSIDRVYSEKREVVISEIAFVVPGEGNRWFDINIIPLLDLGNEVFGAKITFTDVTRARLLAQELQQSKGDLETAYEELQSSNEELETTNEELQSTIEELETTNEELQSTNEELETMNEELQSTNQELEAVNDELGERADEVVRANAFLESILTSVRFAVVAINSALIVQGWNRHAYELWGVPAEEARGASLLNLDIGLPLDTLLKPIRDCLAGNEEEFETVIEARNRRGRSFHCRVSISSIRIPDRPPTGAVVFLEEVVG